jgi:hypothetical protein
MINKKKINKSFFENVTGLLLSIYAFYLIVPSTLGDIIFVVFKKETSAEIIQISKNGTTRKPFVIKVKYFDNELVKDNIFTNSRGVENLSQGQFVDIYYCNILERDTYLLESAPGFFILFVQTLCFLGILIVIFSCSRGIYNNFSD